VVPEVVMTQGHLTPTWQDARLFAAVAGAAVFFWRRSVLATLLFGMAVYLPLHLGLGW
jgi:branched-subunit amino acid transport protein